MNKTRVPIGYDKKTVKENREALHKSGYHAEGKEIVAIYGNRMRVGEKVVYSKGHSHENYRLIIEDGKIWNLFGQTVWIREDGILDPFSCGYFIDENGVEHEG